MSVARSCQANRVSLIWGIKKHLILTSVLRECRKDRFTLLNYYLKLRNYTVTPSNTHPNLVNEKLDNISRTMLTIHHQIWRHAHQLLFEIKANQIQNMIFTHLDLERREVFFFSIEFLPSCFLFWIKRPANPLRSLVLEDVESNTIVSRSRTETCFRFT